MDAKTFLAVAAFAIVGALPAGAAPEPELGRETAYLPLEGVIPRGYALLFSVGLSLGMLALMALGRRLGARLLKADPAQARKGLAAVEGAVFSLLGLLLAFCFYGAAERFDARRELVIQEADRIRSAWLQLDLLAEEDRPTLRELFRQYADSRLNTYRKLPDASAVRAEVERSRELQNVLWQRALAACRGPTPLPAATHLVPALTQMFSIAERRIAAARLHPPRAVFAMLFALSLMSAVLIGHGMAGRKSRSWTHILGIVLTLSAAIYLIYELEFPREGLIRIDAMDQVLVEVRRSMN